MTHPDAIALVGPTASGKTAAALALAKALAPRGGAEIISMDSALVYRGMDIGTAKPSPQERQVVPHHLIDILDPREVYSAADFARDALRLMQEIRRRGRTPLIVGGTLLYFKALTEGLSDMPPADPVVRERIQQRATDLGWPALHAQLQAIDPLTAARLAPADSQRIGRALEVWMVSGRPMSSFHGQRSPSRALRIPVLSLEPLDRAWLHARIGTRLQAMMQEGFMDEVRRLRAREDLHASMPSMRCVGYRQAWEGLAQGWSEAQILEQSLFATRQLAKRQLTWLRGMPLRSVIAADAHNAMAQTVAMGLQCLCQWD